MTFDRYGFFDKVKATESIEFSEGQKRLMAGAEAGSQGLSAQQSQVRVVADLYILERYQRMVNTLIDSNETLANANERHASSLKWATWALVAATILLALITALDLWFL